MSPTPGLDIVRRLTGVTWQWRKDDQTDAGVIAQDVEQVMPYAVVTDTATGYKSVKYNALLAPLIQSTKELSNMCVDNEKRLGALEEKSTIQERDIASLKKENQDLREQIKEIKNILRKRAKN